MISKYLGRYPEAGADCLVGADKGAAASIMAYIEQAVDWALGFGFIFAAVAYGHC
jgi:hypothetical protein